MAALVPGPAVRPLRVGRNNDPKDVPTWGQWNQPSRLELPERAGILLQGSHLRDTSGLDRA